MLILSEVFLPGRCLFIPCLFEMLLPARGVSPFKSWCDRSLSCVALQKTMDHIQHQCKPVALSRLSLQPHVFLTIQKIQSYHRQRDLSKILPAVIPLPLVISCLGRLQSKVPFSAFQNFNYGILCGKLEPSQVPLLNFTSR